MSGGVDSYLTISNYVSRAVTRSDQHMLTWMYMVHNCNGSVRLFGRGIDS